MVVARQNAFLPPMKNERTMIRRSYLLTCAVVAILAAPAGASARKPSLVVLDLQDKGVGLSEGSMERLADHFAIKLHKAARVIPRRRVREYLKRTKKASCHSEACHKGIARALNAVEVVSSQMLRVGSRCVLNVRVVGARRLAVRAAMTQRLACNVDAAMAALDAIASDLPRRLRSRRSGCGSACQATRSAARRARLAKALADLGPLKVLGSKGGGKDTASTLLTRGDPGPKLDKAFKGVRREQVPRVIVHGNIDRKAMNRTLSMAARGVKRCHERVLKNNPRLLGHVSVRMTINGKGRVATARITRATIVNRGAQACVLATMRRLRFPPPNSRLVTVTVPFFFQSMQ